MSITLRDELLQTILEGARRLYPREMVLLLRGQKRKSELRISEVLVPPLATHGSHFADVRLHMLPMDFSIVGTVHSHPSGNLSPSHTDLNHVFGIVLMIVGFPFMDERNAAAYNRNGEKLSLQIIKR
jgi:proteasome lid subunit RPN8/RPN11